jgi:hypothetical protein
VIDVDALLGRLRTLPNFESVHRQLSTSHTSYDAVGDIARTPGEASHTPEQWEALVTGFDGEVVCGVDLDELPLGR